MNVTNNNEDRAEIGTGLRKSVLDYTKRNKGRFSVTRHGNQAYGIFGNPLERYERPKEFRTTNPYQRSEKLKESLSINHLEQNHRLKRFYRVKNRQLLR